MKKKINKILCVFLIAVVLCLSFSVFAFAETQSKTVGGVTYTYDTYTFREVVQTGSNVVRTFNYAQLMNETSMTNVRYFGVVVTKDGHTRTPVNYSVSYSNMYESMYLYNYVSAGDMSPEYESIMNVFVYGETSGTSVNVEVYYIDFTGTLPTSDNFAYYNSSLVNIVGILGGVETIVLPPSYSELAQARLEGYNEGYAQGLEEHEAVRDTIFSVIDAPFVFISNLLNFELLGINLAGLFFFLVTAVVVIFIVKKVKG